MSISKLIVSIKVPNVRIVIEPASMVISKVSIGVSLASMLVNKVSM
jgi:hypothetical protein